MNSPPSQLLRVCIGLYLGEVNISWDLLTCHLQNGFDVAGYVIQYTHSPNGSATNISISRSRSDGRLLYHQKSDSSYSCLVNVSLFIPGVTYRFQVAAENVRGVGSFSDPVSFVRDSQGKQLF